MLVANTNNLYRSSFNLTIYKYSKPTNIQNEITLWVGDCAQLGIDFRLVLPWPLPLTLPYVGKRGVSAWLSPKLWLGSTLTIAKFHYPTIWTTFNSKMNFTVYVDIVKIPAINTRDIWPTFTHNSWGNCKNLRCRYFVSNTLTKKLL